MGADLPGSVLPFILRNVTLAGIDSVNAPQGLRLQTLARLATDLDPGKLACATGWSAWSKCLALRIRYSWARCVVAPSWTSTREGRTQGINHDQI